MKTFETDEELEARIHFRRIETPCCGNCKWFYREYEDTECKNLQTHWEDEIYLPRLWPDEHYVCDLFERKETKI